MIQEVKTHDPIVPNVSIWFDLGVFLKFLGIEVTKNNHNVEGLSSLLNSPRTNLRFMVDAWFVVSVLPLVFVIFPLVDDSFS